MIIEIEVKQYEYIEDFEGAYIAIKAKPISKLLADEIIIAKHNFVRVRQEPDSSLVEVGSREVPSFTRIFLTFRQNDIEEPKQAIS